MTVVTVVTVVKGWAAWGFLRGLLAVADLFGWLGRERA